MLRKRVSTAVVISLLVIYVLSFSPGILFYPLVTALAALLLFLAGTEFAALRWNVMDGTLVVQEPKPSPEIKHFLSGFSYCIALILFSVFYFVSHGFLEKALLFSVAWLFFCFVLAVVFVFRGAKDINTASNKLLNYLAGFVYLVLPCLCLIWIVANPFPDLVVRNGHVYFCLLVVFMGDTGAFFVGKRFGKHLLIPRVSPKKSVEGSLGGLVFSALAAVVSARYFGLPFSLGFALVAGVCIGAAGQVGDLLESAFKRAGGFKDSGHLLPGHGGVLDRIDSLILALPVAYLFFYGHGVFR